MWYVIDFKGLTVELELEDQGNQNYYVRDIFIPDACTEQEEKEIENHFKGRTISVELPEGWWELRS